MNKYSRSMRILNLSLERTQSEQGDNLRASASELIANSLQHSEDHLNVSVASDISLLDNDFSFRDFTDLEPSLPSGATNFMELLPPVSQTNFIHASFSGESGHQSQSSQDAVIPLSSEPCQSPTPPPDGSAILAPCEPSQQSTQPPEDSTVLAPCEPSQRSTQPLEDSTVLAPCEPSQRSTQPPEDSTVLAPCEPSQRSTQPQEDSTVLAPCEPSQRSTQPPEDSTVLAPCEPSQRSTHPPEDSTVLAPCEPSHQSTQPPEDSTVLAPCEPSHQSTPPSLHDDLSIIPSASSLEESILPPAKKRRKRCVENWKQTQNTKKREHGEEYMGRTLSKETGKYIPTLKEKRTLGERCTCKPTANKNCSQITDIQRQEIFEDIWQKSWPERKVLMKALIDVVTPAQRKSVSEKRQNTFIHHLTVSGRRTRVCKVMFLRTTGLRETWVRSVLSDDGDSDRHQNNEEPPSGPQALRRTSLDEFLDCIPKLPSHYRRQHSSKVYVEPVFQSFAELYREYCSFASSKELTAVGRTVFMEEMRRRNIDIFKPRNDMCDTCISYENGLLDEPTFTLHRERELKARAAMKSDTEEAQRDTRLMTITMDLQAVLLCPKLKASALYYKTKLCCHNFTIFNNVTKQCHCYLWSESEGGLTANEFASCLLNYLEAHSTLFDSCIIFSDGCTYQNRNKIMAKALSYFVQKTGKTVTQKILEKGHTQMPVDSVHSVIERKIKNKCIYSPSDYQRYISEARQNPEPYQVSYLNFSFFRNFENVSSLRSVRPGTRVGEANVTDIRQLLYAPSGDISYKLNFSDDSEWRVIPMKRNESALVSQEPVPLYSERLKIKHTKYNDLQSLKSVVPSDVHGFYDQLPH